MPRLISLVRRSPKTYRPHLLPLEDRLPLGDGVLGLLAGAALLPAATGGTGLQPVPSMDRLQTCATVPGQLASFTLDLHGANAFDSPAVVAGTTIPEEHARADFRTSSPGRPARRADGPEAVTPMVVSMPAVASPGASTLAIQSPAAVISRSADALLSLLAGMRTTPAPAAGTVMPTQEAQVKESFGKLPLSFEQNVGQTDASVHFFTRGPGYGLYLTSTEAVMVLQQPRRAGGVNPLVQDAAPDWMPHQGVDTPRSPEEPPAVVRMQFFGANPNPTVTGRGQQPGIVNYFLGNDPAKWHTNVHTFGRVEYDEVYPGIDLVYYGNQRQLEYDFVVSPGADPNTIRLNVTGAERVEIDGTGDLVLHAGGQEVRQHKPFIYQEVNGTRREVASRFVLDGQQVRFEVAAYDAGRALVIDPILTHSTYLGGATEDHAFAVTVDKVGNAFVAGQTNSVNFPTTPDSYQPLRNRGFDAFVAKLSADGTHLVYSTYLGGDGDDTATGISIDPDEGDAYVMGHTSGAGFPVTAGAFQTGYGGGARDYFVTKVNAGGANLLYSTYLGGSAVEHNYSPGPNLSRILVLAGYAFVTGSTSSRDFPITASGYQTTYAGGASDAVMALLSQDGSSVAYSTYLGGGEDTGTGVAVDGAGMVYLSGITSSGNFPVSRDAFQAGYGGYLYDGFLAKLGLAGEGLVYSTYFGGSSDDYSLAVAVDLEGNAYLAGSSSSSNLYTSPGAYQRSLRGGYDNYVMKIRPGPNPPIYSTYLGGTGNEAVGNLAIDFEGNAYVFGYGGSSNYPVTPDAIQASYSGAGNDTVLTKVTPDGSALAYSTYFGGTGDDWGRGLALDGDGNMYVAGHTTSGNLRTSLVAVQPANHGGTDAFVARIGNPGPATLFYVYPDSGAIRAGEPFDLFVLALDAQLNIISDYTGEIAFFSTDEQATLPPPYTFQRSDQGVAYFFEGMTFLTPGTQELYVLDTATYKVWGYAVFEVV